MRWCLARRRLACSRFCPAPYYLRNALAPYAALRESTLAAALGLPEADALVGDGVGAPRIEAVDETQGADADDAPRAVASFADVIVLVDVGRMDAEIEEALSTWVSEGGLLVRFAGPRLAALAAEDRGFGAPAEDPLLPVALRGGGRALGGKLSWAEPQPMRAFPDRSPFAGLEINDEVTISLQVLAEPGPGLASRVWAALRDGTPLVTSRAIGGGRVVLFSCDGGARLVDAAFVGVVCRNAGSIGGFGAGAFARGRTVGGGRSELASDQTS